MAAAKSLLQELASSKGLLLRQRLWCVLLGAMFILATRAIPVAADPATILPQGGNFVAGSGAIGAPAQGSLNITQSNSRGVIDWHSFSIGSDGRVSINNGTGATLNRVIGGD